MRVSYSLVVAALASFVSCQLPNSFEVPASGSYPPLTAGQPYTFTWDNLSGSTVTLTLRDGPASNLNTGTVIEANVKNTGSFTYTPPISTPAGTSYTIEITNDQDPTEVNYTPSFQIISSASPSASASTSASASGSTSISNSVTSTATDSTSVTSSASGSTSMSSTATASASTQTTLSTTTGASTTSHSATSASSVSSSAVATQKTGGAMQNGAGLLHVGAGLAGMAVVVML